MTSGPDAAAIGRFPERFRVSVPIQLERRGVEAKLVIHESAPVGACRRPCLRGGKDGGLRGERNGAYRTGRYTVEGKAGRQQLRRLIRELAIRMRRETVEYPFGTMKGRRGRTHLFFSLSHCATLRCISGCARH